MRIRQLAPVLALLSLGATGCSARDEPAPLANAAPALAARLLADTGVAWTVYGTTGGGRSEPEVLGPERPVQIPGATRQDQAKGFFAKYADALPQLSGVQLGAARTEDDADGSGVVKIGYLVPGTKLTVFDAFAAMHFDPGGGVRYVDPGPIVDLSGVPTDPKIDLVGAASSAHAAIVATCGEDVAGTPVHELGAYSDATGKARLAYKLEFEEDAGPCIGPAVFVDASTGTAITVRARAGAARDLAQGGKRYFWNTDDVKSIPVSQRVDSSFELSDYDGSPHIFTARAVRSGTVQIDLPVTSPVLGLWGDIDRGVSVDAHFHTRRALDYFQAVFGRNGIDGRGGDLHVITDDATGPNANGPNAFYRAADGKIRFSRQYGPVTLRSGAKRTFFPMSLSFDVVVHELAHGIVHHTSNLVYQGESGAINESFADVMGVTAEHWLPERRGSADMILGKEVSEDGLGLRDLENPTSRAVYGQHADYPSRYVGPDDNGGVHRNSGIGNRAFSLMTLGGKTSTLSIPRALGFEAARYVWWETVLRASDPNLTWRKLALSQTILAKNLGFETNAAVACAWVAVGVLERHEVDPDFTRCGLPATAPVQASCAGVENGVVCSDITPNTAYICRNGAIAGAHYCFDFSRTCAHPADTFRGSLDAAGGLVCR